MLGPGYRRRVRRPAPVLVAATLLASLPLLSGCAPGTPDQDSWRVDAIRAVGDVSSAVATMELSLERDDRIFGPYLRTVAVQSEENAGTAAQHLSARQPPDAYLRRSAYVTSQLDDAQSLLTEVRIAVVRRDSAAYADLLRRLGRTDDRLNRVEDALRALPDDRSRP